MRNVWYLGGAVLVVSASVATLAWTRTMSSPVPRPLLVAPPPEATCFPILHSGSFGYGTMAADANTPSVDPLALRVSPKSPCQGK